VSGKEYVELIHDEIILDDPKKQAVFFDFGDNKIWIPRSLITDYSDETVTVELWFAEQEGLEEYEA